LYCLAIVSVFIFLKYYADTNHIDKQADFLYTFQYVTIVEASKRYVGCMRLYAKGVMMAEKDLQTWIDAFQEN